MNGGGDYLNSIIEVRAELDCIHAIIHNDEGVNHGIPNRLRTSDVVSFLSAGLESVSCPCRHTSQTRIHKEKERN